MWGVRGGVDGEELNVSVALNWAGSDVGNFMYEHTQGGMSCQGRTESQPTPESGCEHGQRFGWFDSTDPSQGFMLCSPTQTGLLVLQESELRSRDVNGRVDE